MKFSLKKSTWALLALVLLLALLGWMERGRSAPPVPLGLLLLVPDDVPLDSQWVEVWKDAAREEGVQLSAMTTRDWTLAYTRHRVAWEGVIVPDTFHRRATAGFIQALKQYVQGGGRLMAVYDGATLSEDGLYLDAQANLSALVGMQYSLYATLKDKLVQQAAVLGSAHVLEEIGAPPGRYQARVATGAAAAPGDGTDPLEEVVNYADGLQTFQSLATEGQPNSAVLLKNSQGSVLASRHRVGQGETMFVNLPLTYLKQRADGTFLHGFLRYFAVKMLGQPRLAETPAAQGVAVLNWHVDAKPAMPSMKKLQDLGLFETEGPYSFHITAGPDVNTPGDGGGLDLDNNPEARALFQQLQRQGHAIGSHGGWIHNHFGLLANENNQDEMLPFLEKNYESVSALIGAAPLEYSAPMGNQPSWANTWLESKGVLATYQTGNVGMGPTRLWRDKQRSSNLWTFPVMTMGNVATAEDVFFKGIRADVYEAWLLKVAKFIEDKSAMRLVYFHPPGAMLYPNAVVGFVDQVADCRKALRCRWMTLTQAAQFLSRREQADWRFEPIPNGWGLTAHHPDSLNEMAWRFPKSRFAQPTVAKGLATVSEKDGDWLLVAGQGVDLLVEIQELQ